MYYIIVFLNENLCMLNNQPAKLLASPIPTFKKKFMEINTCYFPHNWIYFKNNLLVIRPVHQTQSRRYPKPPSAAGVDVEPRSLSNPSFLMIKLEPAQHKNEIREHDVYWFTIIIAVYL